MLASVVRSTDAYGSLISRLIWAIGGVPTAGIQDRVVRDLASDIFDFLFATRRPIFESQLAVSYPLARRAYESLSLLAVCIQDSSLAERWHGGAQISNTDVRKALETLPFKEPVEDLRALYKFFSTGSHPNRDLIPERYLGDGNGYTLGSIGRPDLVLTVDACLNLLRLWVWFAAAVGYYFREQLSRSDRSWGSDYLSLYKDAEAVAGWLMAEYNRLLSDVQAEYDENGIKKPQSNGR